MLENIKNAIYMGIETLFATAVVDEATGDIEAYRAKLESIGIIAATLGINTEITEVTLSLKPKSDEMGNSVFVKST